MAHGQTLYVLNHHSIQFLKVSRKNLYFQSSIPISTFSAGNVIVDKNQSKVYFFGGGFAQSIPAIKVFQSI